MLNTTFDDFIADSEQHRAYEREALALGASELILELMEKGQVNKTTLAELSGNSKAHISQLLTGSRNMTVHTLADLAFVLGHRVDLSSVPLSGATQAP